MFAARMDACSTQGCLQHAGMLAGCSDAQNAQGGLQRAGMFAARKAVCSSVQGCWRHAGKFAACRDICSAWRYMWRTGMLAAGEDVCSLQGCSRHAGMLAAHRDARSHFAGARDTGSSFSGFPCLSFPFPESKHRTRTRRFARGSASQDTAALGNLAVLQQLGWRLCSQRLEGGQGERWGPAACQM